MRMYLDTTAAIPRSNSGLFATLQQGVSNWFERRRRIAQITLELDMHTDHALADMGLARGDIYAVARGMSRRG